MSAQLRLPAYVDHIEEAAIEFDRRNPRVYRLFADYALRARRRGKVLGAKAIWERLRWDLEVESDEESPKLNNSHVSVFARWAARDHDELRGYFRFRLRTAR